MSNFRLKTPVAFIIFNRPDTTEKVFAEIAKAKPPKLLVIADGPREGRPGEKEKCIAARAIIEHVDWECEVLTEYATSNLGCKLRVSSGLDWVFSSVEEAIILEDDCLPHPSFFQFCEELLDKYRHDERIAQISGVNFQFGRRQSEDSYYFSRFNHIWGWASWRRAWKFYDVNLTQWSKVKNDGWLEGMLGDSKEVRFWHNIFQSVEKGDIDTWDFQWVFSCWINDLLTVIPSVNLVSNIGYGPEATHTKGVSRLANMDVKGISFPLTHPNLVIRDIDADNYVQKTCFASGTHPLSLRRVIGKLTRMLRMNK